MKLNFSYLDNDVLIDNNKILSIEVENKNYFYRIVNDLNTIYNGNISDDLTIYDNENNEIDLTNKISVMIDYFNIDFNSKKLINTLSKSIIENIDIEDLNKIKFNYKKIKNIISKSLNEYDFSISFIDELEMENLFKILKISINKKKSLIDNLFLAIDLENKFKLNKLLVFINLKQYLSKEELVEFYKYCIYNNVMIILVDSQTYGTTTKYEKKLIIDSNLDEYLL